MLYSEKNNIISRFSNSNEIEGIWICKSELPGGTTPLKPFVHHWFFFFCPLAFTQRPA